MYGKPDSTPHKHTYKYTTKQKLENVGVTTQSETHITAHQLSSRQAGKAQQEKTTKVEKVEGTEKFGKKMCANTCTASVDKSTERRA